VQAAAAHQSIDSFLQSGQGGIKMMQQLLQSTEKVVRQFLQYPSVQQVPLADLKTNPFRSAKAAPVDDGSGRRRRQDEERQAVLKTVQGLQLQSIISGTRKACMINNMMYQEGQQVSSLTLEKITPNSVIVKSGVYRFELKINK
jgi:hypothetical protein